MAKFKHNFKRIEQKYLLNERQLDMLMSSLAPLTVPDDWGESRICNIYYDTPDYRVVRRSLEKPKYKEKLRLRTYGEPTGESAAFVEIKKKYRGVVFKRRVDMHYDEAVRYLDGAPPPERCQITNEIDWFVCSNPGLRPSMLISYFRTALYAADDPELLITFDRHIMWRADRLDLREGVEGRELLGEGECLMEIKIPGAMPLWLAELLDRFGIYPVSFSKYGRAYCTMISESRRATVAVPGVSKVTEIVRGERARRRERAIS